MRLINELNLPKALERALNYDEVGHHIYGKYSATQLLREPLEVMLQRKYKDLITYDVRDMIDILIGNAIHYLLQKANEGVEGVEVEAEFIATFGDIDISGKADFWDKENGIIQDYKTPKVYTIQKGDFKEWEEQLNIYAYMVRYHGYEVNRIEVVAILKDWSKVKAKNDPDYPQSQVVVIPLKLWSREEQERFIQERINKLEKWVDVEDVEKLPECEDKWEREKTYAVKKVGSTRATKVFKKREEAEKYLEGKEGYKIEERGGEPIKCMHYCAVKDFCPYWNKVRGKYEGEIEL